MIILINVILNMFDAINFYFILFSLMDRKVKFTKKGLLLGVMWAVANGISAYNLNIYTYKMILYISLLIIIYIYCRKKIYETFILFMLMFLMLFLIQFLVAIIITTGGIVDAYMLISQALSLCLTLVMYYKIPTNKIYTLTENNIIARWIFFILNIVFFISIFYFNFETEKISQLSIYFIFLLLLSILGFLNTIINDSKEIKTMKSYETYVSIMHDYVNDMMAISSIISTTNDIFEIRKKVSKYFEIICIDDNMNEDVALGHRIIATFIYNKMKKIEHKQIDIQKEIVYEKPHKEVEDSIIMQMLGILMDNAIDASKKGSKIAIYVYIDTHLVVIEVENEYDGLTPTQIEAMFTKGYSTKKTEHNEKRGYGLYNLGEIVKAYKGNIKVEDAYKNGINVITIGVIIGMGVK